MSETKVKHFDSLSEFVNGCNDISYYGHNWCGDISFNEAKRKALNGDDSLVPEAEKLLEKLDIVDGGEEIRTWMSSPMGAYPVIPEVLAGMPDSMRIKAPCGSQSPVKIGVCITCSAGFSASDMQKRGLTVLALLMKLQQVQPVELYLINTLDSAGRRNQGNSFLVIPIESKPLSLAHACFSLCHVGFARHLAYNWAKENHGSGGHWQEDRSASQIKNHIGFSETDLYIEESYLFNDMIKRPVEWINSQLKQFSKGIKD